MTDFERLKLDTQPVKLRIESEPYAKYLGRKYGVVIDVYDVKRKRDYFLIIDPQSLSQPLYELETTEGKLKELVVWINKESDEKYAKYEVVLA